MSQWTALPGASQASSSRQDSGDEADQEQDQLRSASSTPAVAGKRKAEADPSPKRKRPAQARRIEPARNDSPHVGSTLLLHVWARGKEIEANRIHVSDGPVVVNLGQSSQSFLKGADAATNQHRANVSKPATQPVPGSSRPSVSETSKSHNVIVISDSDSDTGQVIKRKPKPRRPKMTRPMSSVAKLSTRVAKVDLHARRLSSGKDTLPVGHSAKSTGADETDNKRSPSTMPPPLDPWEGRSKPMSASGTSSEGRENDARSEAYESSAPPEDQVIFPFEDVDIETEFGVAASTATISKASASLAPRSSAVPPVEPSRVPTSPLATPSPPGQVTSPSSSAAGNPLESEAPDVLASFYHLPDPDEARRLLAKRLDKQAEARTNEQSFINLTMQSAKRPNSGPVASTSKQEEVTQTIIAPLAPSRAPIVSPVSPQEGKTMARAALASAPPSRAQHREILDLTLDSDDDLPGAPPALFPDQPLLRSPTQAPAPRPVQSNPETIDLTLDSDDDVPVATQQRRQGAHRISAELRNLRRVSGEVRPGVVPPAPASAVKEEHDYLQSSALRTVGSSLDVFGEQGHAVGPQVPVSAETAIEEAGHSVAVSPPRGVDRRTESPDPLADNEDDEEDSPSASDGGELVYPESEAGDYMHLDEPNEDGLTSDEGEFVDWGPPNPTQALARGLKVITSGMARLLDQPECKLAKDIPRLLQDNMGKLDAIWLRTNMSQKVFEATIQENTCRDEPNAPPIRVINPVDDEAATPPFEFYYSNEIWYNTGVPLPDYSSLVGCSCEGKCDPKSKTCSCVKRQKEMVQGELEGFMYDKNGLRKPVDPAYCIVECNYKCQCDEDCPNRVVQNGRKCQVNIIKTQDKGWGIFNGEKTLPAGTFIGIYAGELILAKTVRPREKYYIRVLNRSYLYTLDWYWLQAGEGKDGDGTDNHRGDEKGGGGSGDDSDADDSDDSDDEDEGPYKYMLDAFYVGNFTRFLNHSCDPNCAVVPVFIHEAGNEKALVCLFTIKPIRPFEELCFSYHGRIDEGELPPPTDHRSEYAQCKCGAEKCTGIMFK